MHGGVTIRAAFKAWTRHEAAEDARRRKNAAEADLAELTLAERRGEIVSRLKLAVTDVMIRVRSFILHLDYIPAKSAQRYMKDFNEAQIFDGVADIVNGKGKTK